MTQSEIERIADGLSEAQRRAVLWLHAEGSWRVRSTGDINETPLYCIMSKQWGKPGFEIVSIAHLAKRRDSGVREKGRPWPNAEYQLTPLGLAVRKHIMEKSK